METATGIIHESLFAPQHKAAVIEQLIGMTLPGKSKARILKDWAKWTGAKLAARDLELVEASGFEAPPQIKIPGA